MNHGYSDDDGSNDDSDKDSEDGPEDGPENGPGNGPENGPDDDFVDGSRPLSPYEVGQMTVTLLWRENNVVGLLEQMKHLKSPGYVLRGLATVAGMMAGLENKKRSHQGSD